MVSPEEILGGLPGGQFLDPCQGGHSLREAGRGMDKWTNNREWPWPRGSVGGGGRSTGRRMRKGGKRM